MWFLKGRPYSITVNALIASLPMGYQATNYRFKVTIEPGTGKDDKMWIGIPFPWAPHKVDGSYTDIAQQSEQDVLSTLEPLDDIVYLQRKDLELHIKPRALKKSQEADLAHVQELCHWYLEDVGIATTWIESDKWYQLNFTHKIAADSCLFFSSRLPTLIHSHTPKLDYKLWVLDAWGVDPPKHLQRVEHQSTLFSTDRLQCFSFKDWVWDDDTKIHTENWESSDDISANSEELVKA